MQKALKKKLDDVGKRLGALRPKLDDAQLETLRAEENTYSMVRSEGGLGMNINQDCDVESVKPGSAAEAASIPPNCRIVSLNGMPVTVRRQPHTPLAMSARQLPADLGASCVTRRTATR